MLSLFSHVQLCATPWAVAHQAPLSMGFSRQKYRSGLPCTPPGDLPKAKNECLQHWQVGSLPLVLVSPLIAYLYTQIHLSIGLSRLRMEGCLSFAFPAVDLLPSNKALLNEQIQ